MNPAPHGPAAKAGEHTLEKDRARGGCECSRSTVGSDPANRSSGLDQRIIGSLCHAGSRIDRLGTVRPERDAIRRRSKSGPRTAGLVSSRPVCGRAVRSLHLAGPAAPAGGAITEGGPVEDRPRSEEAIRCTQDVHEWQFWRC